MTLKEKKTLKGTPFAVIKFSDLSKVFELFLFSEILELNRKYLSEGKSFLITVIKDKQNQDNRFKRVNVRKISSLDKIIQSNIVLLFYFISFNLCSFVTLFVYC